MAKKKEDEEEEFQDIFDGPLKERKFGFRIDDEVIATIMAGDEAMILQGRLLRHSATYVEILDEEGTYHRVNNDWIITVELVKHKRPHPSEDKEYKKKKSGKKDKKDEKKQNDIIEQFYV